MFILVFLICLAASTMGGICGVGGGVIIKPLLDSLGIMSVSTVSFLSGLTVLAMAVINVWKNRKGKELELSHSLPLGIGAAAGGVLGKRLFSLLKEVSGRDNRVGAVQAMVLGFLILGTLVYVLNKKRIRTKEVEGVIAPVIIGLFLGICSSFLGIGGGPMNLAVLYYFFSMDTRKAAVNSILIILLSQAASLIMTLVSRTVPSFDWGMLLAMVGAGALGGFLSAKLHRKLSAAVTDRLFIAMMVMILGICVWNVVRLM